MRLLHTCVAAFIATLCVAQDLPNDRALVARQATTTSSNGDAPSATSPSATTKTPTDGATSTSPTPTQTVSTGNTSQTSANDAISTPTTASIRSTIANTSATPGPTSISTQDVLPIQPSITPALGIAGVILIAAGLVLCFVGIKNRSIQIFLSTSLLVALSIEVLIIYVMNPPVSDAVQGGYLVAGVLGGTIIGAIAMIFKEVTEGLGCVLGGFTFAMWLLVLAPGGTIKSDSGRIILIAVFCVVCFSLSFSRYTRHYGIIACTSFAGATVFILGVDCFSRAGLKEFWLYIWDLNPDEFPLGTNTYPFTRYIRVEIALNIIIAVLGVMSQIKLWKIVRERRSQRDAERLQDEENRDQLETEIGRDLEARNRRDRANWEGTYGDKDATNVQVDSAIGSSMDGYSKNSTEVMEREVETIELSEFPDSSKRWSKRGSNPLVRIRPASVESKSEQRLIGTTLHSGFFMDFDFNQPPPEPQPSSQRLRGESSMAGADHAPVEAPQRSSMKSTTFEVETSKPVRQEKRVSVEDGTTIHDRRGVSVNRLSLTPEPLDEADEAMHSPFEDDRASSIAATAAEDPDLDALSEAFGSRAPSPYVLSSARNSMLHVETPLEEDDEEILQRPVRPTVETSKPPSLAPKSPAIESMLPSEDGASHVGTDASPVGNLSEHLPRKLSRAASQYRTTEWAKEAGRAEPEPIEELTEGTLDAVRVDMKSAAEAARAEENNASQKPEPRVVAVPEPEAEPERESQQGPRPSTGVESTGMHSPDVIPPSRDSAQLQSRNPYRASMNLSRQSLNANPTPVFAHLNSSPHVSLQRAGSSPSQLLVPRRSSNPLQMQQNKPMMDSSRNVSAPLVNQTLVESPAEDSLSPMNTQHRLSTSASNPTLLDVREHKLKQRVTSTSFNAVSAPTPTPNLVGQADSQFTASEHGSGSGPFADGSLPEEEEEEEMTLAERKALVKEQVRRQSGSSAVLPRPSSVHRLSQPNMPNWPLSAQPPLPTQQPQQLVRMNSNSQQLIYDSHQPRRTSAFDQNKAGQNWSAWQSQKAVAANQRTTMLTADGQMDMLRQQRANKEFETRQRAEQQQAVQAQMDAHMRMGGMHDAHRNALSRMQNKANKHASVQGG